MGRLQTRVLVRRQLSQRNGKAADKEGDTKVYTSGCRFEIGCYTRHALRRHDGVQV